MRMLASILRERNVSKGPPVVIWFPGSGFITNRSGRSMPASGATGITQAPAPALPIPRGRPSVALLAHVLVAKYCDHLPLYRQSEIYARDGLDLDRSTME
ncbi:MAG: family transposase [Rhodospirillales bacterium]|jgi:transposase|nr:family transposase [Rhodospirillales bacterium]